MKSLRLRFPEPCAQQWDDMKRTDCGRLCESCSTIIHDLSQFSFEDAEALLRSNKRICVRAKINPEGGVLLKPAAKRNSGKMIAAVGLATSLLATNGPALANKNYLGGIIAGTVEDAWRDTTVIAIGAKGKKYRAKVDIDGRYEIKNLPAGTYRLKFSTKCMLPNDRHTWYGDTIVVTERAVQTSNTKSYVECTIIVGMVEVEKAVS